MTKELEPYLIKFNEDGTIKAKEYPSDYTIRSLNRQEVIIIIYDDSTFLANNSIQRVWTRKDNGFL